MSSKIAELRRKVAFGQFELTSHAVDEMEQDGFTIMDVKSAIYSGRIVATQRREAEPRKYVVTGRAFDGRRLNLVCRLTPLGRLRIITVYGK
jgi:hypothetical protein